MAPVKCFPVVEFISEMMHVGGHSSLKRIDLAASMEALKHARILGDSRWLPKRVPRIGVLTNRRYRHPASSAPL